MPAYKIRPASRDDSLAIRYLVRQARVNPFGLDWRHFVVAEFGGETVIGCGQVKLHIERQGETSRELASIVVTPGWRGKGVASSVIANLLSQNSCPIYLTCRAILGGFYQRFGFRTIPVARMPLYFRRINRMMDIIQRLGLVSEQLFVMALWE